MNDVGEQVQIVISMSGFGERFRRAGYALPKPLIPVDGRPIIEHVIGMFPGESDLIFICNEDHLANASYTMRETLEAACPGGRVVGIPAHKLGPVHAVQQAAELLDLDRPVLVNYCDFGCYWDWQHFLRFVRESGCDGALPAYRGFHPHSLGTTNYAYMREHRGWVLDIQEKQPFTDNRMEEFASSGSYYFASARRMLRAFEAQRIRELHVNGEFYVSLAYKPLIDEGAAIAVYELQHFLQWGTPEDLREYQRWSHGFERLAAPPPRLSAPRGALVVPMAGLGERFSRAGYALAKPLIQVSGRPMAVQAALDLPAADVQAFVVRGDMAGLEEVVAELRSTFPQGLAPVVPAATAGQACTADVGVAALLAQTADDLYPLTFGACDSGCLFDETKLQTMLDADDTDVIIWAVRGHAHAVRHPHMYGWIDEADGVVRAVSVKEPLRDPAKDPIVIGTFTFRNATLFRRCLDRMVARDARVNGEFYLDTCINDALAMGLRCRVLEVDAYFSWGTPQDLQTFEYWQSCFHKLETHPYSLNADARVPATQVSQLAERYRQQLPQAPRRLAREASPSLV